MPQVFRENRVSATNCLSSITVLLVISNIFSATLFSLKFSQTYLQFAAVIWRKLLAELLVTFVFVSKTHLIETSQLQCFPCPIYLTSHWRQFFMKSLVFCRKKCLKCVKYFSKTNAKLLVV